MCGIAGILTQIPDPMDQIHIKSMCDVVRHRGPDGFGYYHDSHVALGHRRLSIIDLTDNGKQPMSNEDGRLWITFNGEIYNYKELRADLLASGHIFRSNTDSEVILHLYEGKKEKCVNYLRGMFAFAIWDSENNKLFCARDRLGIKPFYYYKAGEKFLFGSEIKSLLVYPDVPRSLNHIALIDYLYFKYPVGDNTFFQDIMALEPGHYLVFQAGKFSIQQYWDLEFTGDNNDSKEAIIENLSDEIGESIAYHMVSDVPVGTFLSGGIDSSAITAYSSKVYEKKLHTFCCGSRHKNANKDIKYASMVANSLGTKHHELYLSASEFGDFLPKSIWHLDEPGGGSTAIPGYYTAKLARNNVTVLLSGEGADEVFGGYGFYIKFLVETSFLRFNDNIPQMELLKSLPGYLKMLQSRELLVKSLGRSFLPKKKEYLEIRPNLNPANSFNIIDNNVLGCKDYEPFTNLWEKYFKVQQHKSFVDGVQYLDIKTYLRRILHIYDRMCMAVSLENRVPFLDHKLVEFGASIPLKYRYHKLIPKYPLRMCLKNRLPDSVLNRPKEGFTLPVGDWFRNELKEQVHEIILGKSARARGIYNVSEIRRLWDAHQQGAEHTERLWSMISLELWHREFIDDFRPVVHV
jgi:asparagine synthase (glutamine-hydrolysing)